MSDDKMFSLDDLDVTKACETPFEFEVMNDSTGKGTGIFLSVLGSEAQSVTNWTTAQMNARRVAEAMAAKSDPRGKRPHVVKVEDDIDFGTELIARRVVGWRGIKEPYTPENAVLLVKRNQSFREQILAVSNELKNFPTAALKS